MGHIPGGVSFTPAPEEFALIDRAPAAWRFHAKCLRRAFQILARNAKRDIAKIGSVQQRARPRIVDACLMNGGLAIELYLRTILVAKRGGLDPPGQEGFMHHNLVKLSDSADVKLSETERLHLKNMQRFVEWAGKYPSPKKTSDEMMGGMYPLELLHNTALFLKRMDRLCSDKPMADLVKARKAGTKK